MASAAICKIVLVLAASVLVVGGCTAGPRTQRFGAVIGLCWQADNGSGHPLAAIAPPTRADAGPGLPDPSSLAPARRLFVVGGRDQFADAAALGTYAGALGAELQVLAGSDHFFYAREHRVGDAVAAHLRADAD